MRSMLRNGKLIPPTSFAAAVKARKQVDYEGKKIDAQLADAARREAFTQRGDTTAYDDWHRRAQGALKHLNRTARVLDEWIEARSGAEELLRECWEALKRLEIDLDDGLEPEEQDLMARLDTHFQREDKIGRAGEGRQTVNQQDNEEKSA